MAERVRVTKSGSEMRQRNRLAQMRCTPAEYAQLEAAAERVGLTISAFMRHQCLGTAGPRAMRRPPVERAALAQLLGQLGKCGSNLNQIARAVNSGDQVLGIADAIADWRAASAAIMRTLGRGA
jgi:uncharacterized protein (DUF1778 family)